MVRGSPLGPILANYVPRTVLRREVFVELFCPRGPLPFTPHDVGPEKGEDPGPEINEAEIQIREPPVEEVVAEGAWQYPG